MSAFENKPVPVLFLDLDGTVRHGKEELGRFVHGPEDVVVFDEAAARILAARRAGSRIVAITNQGGIALGLANPTAMFDANERTDRLCGYSFDLMEMCPHHPDSGFPQLKNCLCRKPKIGMLVNALRTLSSRHPGEYYPLELALFVGDRPEDKACAENAGIRFQDAAQWRAEVKADL